MSKLYSQYYLDNQTNQCEVQQTLIYSTSICWTFCSRHGSKEWNNKIDKVDICPLTIYCLLSEKRSELKNTVVSALNG